MNTSLSTIINEHQEENIKTIELVNRNDEPVGAIYLQNLDTAQVIISETNTTEKFYCYYKGIGIFFSNFRFIK